MKIEMNVDFLVGKLDAGFKRQAEKGFITIEQMFEEGILKSFKRITR